jgi:uncharacterized membrane protein YhaH (DUF805 family)
MPVNLQKNDEIMMYYYSDENSNTYGPFSIEQLIPKIDSNTLVYRDGISWTNADKIDELKPYFINKKKTEDPRTVSNEPISNIGKKKYFSAPFSFNGRIRRMEYGISFIIYIFIYTSIYNKINDNSYASFFLIPLVWFILAQGAKRCHDRGNSGWYQIIPFYMFWMIFAEGDFNENEYGQSPK